MSVASAGPRLHPPAAGGPPVPESGPARPLGVCVLTAAYPAPSEPTRAVFIENLCRALAALRSPGGGPRFAISVVAPRIVSSDPAQETRGGIPVRRFSYLSSGKRLKERDRIPPAAVASYLAAGFAAALREVNRTRPSVVHCHWVLPSGVIGAALKAATGLPQVLHAHGSDIHRYALSRRWTPAAVLARGLAAWALRRADCILTVSEELARRISEELGVEEERLRRLPMGIDGELFRPGDREEARRALGIDGRRWELLFAGDLAPEKGVAGLARAIAGGPGEPPLRLNLAGDGRERGPLSALARQAPERVRLLGRLPPEELAVWCRAADLLVLPSKGEGAPVSIMEALASGLPVAASAVGGVPELVRPGIEGWLVPPAGSPAEFLSVVRRALSEPAELERIRSHLAAGAEDRTAGLRARELAAVLEEVSLARSPERG
jgi:teichuronic acid biosynthesis glycosyltransferase TuaC